MDKIDLHIENCYGIKKFIHSFDFEKSKTHLIYAPNGAFKTSLAKTFEDIANNEISKDKIFTERIPHRDIKVDGRDILSDEIFVIQRMKNVDFKEASTILANEKLKTEYDSNNSALNESKKKFLKSLQSNFGLKENQIELEITNSFSTDFYTFIETKESEIINIETPFYANIVYNEIFNEKVLKFLKDKDFNIKIREYIDIYDKLVNESNTLFMKGTFNHYNADTVTKSLKDNNFFKAKHKVKINNTEISELDELEKLVKQEKEKILSNPDLSTKFNEIDKALNSNNELRNFRNYVDNNREIIKEFLDLPNFRKKLIIIYFALKISDFKSLVELNKQTKIRRQELIRDAKKEQKLWKKVLDIFNRRFTVPFEISIKNQEDVILKSELATLMFKYSDNGDTKELGGTDLQKVMSTGEERVYYILNIIFQIETRKRIKKKQLIIVDDIADSFDYKNKYAIIEYLQDILDEENFKMLLLTHNFDFYKTIKSRLGSKLNYEGNWRTIKNSNEITLTQGEKRDVFPLLRKNYANCDLSFIACIPFVRNLIEFTIGDDNDDYRTLTSLLHLKPADTVNNIKATKDFEKLDIIDIFNRIFNNWSVSEVINPTEKIYDLIFRKASESNLEDIMDIKSKLCLSLAIRIKAEEYILSKITNIDFLNNILKKDTGHIVGQYKKEFPNDNAIKVLDRVNLMTPENIHVNSFMYEPLMDLSENHLKILYQDVLDLFQLNDKIK